MVLKTHMMSVSPPLLRRPVLEQELGALPASASPFLYSLLQFWSDAAGGEDVPSRDRLDVFTLRPWLGHISIYEAVDGGGDFRIRLEGTSIVAITGEDWTGKRASEVDAKYGCHIADFMREIAHTRKPMVHTMRVFQNEVEFITRLLLPVRARPGGPVDQIFLVIYVDPRQAAA
ncbi:MAG TPA: PAS domain-containing protein [Dongiaceae bacterium]|nr:PAS domain-containing protein [Dongiaceae bacterium]